VLSKERLGRFADMRNDNYELNRYYGMGGVMSAKAASRRWRGAASLGDIETIAHNDAHLFFGAAQNIDKNIDEKQQKRLRRNGAAGWRGGIAWSW